MNETEFLAYLEENCPLMMAYYRLDYMLKCNRLDALSGCGVRCFDEDEIEAQQSKIRALMNNGGK